MSNPLIFWSVLAIMMLMTYLQGRVLGIFFVRLGLYSYVLSAIFTASALIALIAFNQYRLGISYLAHLWFLSIALVLAWGASLIFGRLGVQSAFTAQGIGLLVYVGLIGFGVFNAYCPVVRRIDIDTGKYPQGVRLMVASDLHLGRLVGSGMLNRLTRLIEEEGVDLLLVPGDIMDDTTEFFDKHKMQEALARAMRAPRLGTVATLGNHDLYQENERSAIISKIEESGAILLNDAVVDVAGITLVGRLDDHAMRAQAADLIAPLDVQKPIILLDHRPSEIDHNRRLPIDLQVSGHTHKGQIVPANFIVNALYPVGYGYAVLDGTHFVVTSGLGFWGIPLRLGSRAEVWVIDLH